MTDQAIRQVAQAFAEELQKLRSRTDRSGTWSLDTLELQVSVRESKVDFKLEYRGDCGTVHSANLGKLMDEVYRRAGFDDRAAGELQTASDSLLGLPSPSTDGDASPSDIPF